MVKKHEKLRIVGLVVATLILMGVIVFAVGQSFGFFQYAKQGDTVNVVTIKGLMVNVDNTTVNALNITNAYPVSDATGLTSDPFKFTITNTSSAIINYELKLLNDDDKLNNCVSGNNTCTQLPYQYIRYAYSINDKDYVDPDTLTDDGTIFIRTISAGATTKVSIKIWIDSSAPNAIQGSVFFGKLVLTGVKAPSDTIDPGLYNSSGTLIASWDTLINTYGLDVEHDYTESDFSYDSSNNTYIPNNPSMFAYIVSHNSSLAAGTKLVIGDVDKIGDFAFDYNSTLTEVVIPLGAKFIGIAAFADSSNLKSVVISDTVTNIGQQAFSKSPKLTSIYLGNSVSVIDDYAFSNCAKLTSITFPASVTFIGNNVLHSDLALKYIYVDSGNINYTASSSVLFNKNKTTLIKYPAAKTATSYTIPSTVVAIKDEAFTGNTKLTSVTIPKSVTTIGKFAFTNCTNLATVTLNANSGLTTVGDCAFSNTAWYTAQSQNGTVTLNGQTIACNSIMRE